MIGDDDLRDHFDREYAKGGGTASIARAVLDLFDRTVGAEAELDELGEYSPSEAAEELEKLERVQAWAEQDMTFKEFGDLDEGTLERFARAYDRYEQESFDLADLCRQAGLLGPNDFTTNPLPLIRMFLPID